MPASTSFRARWPASASCRSIPPSNSPVEITGNGFGVSVGGNALVVIAQPDIGSNSLAGISIAPNATVEIANGLIEDNGGDGIDFGEGASVIFISSGFGGSGATNISGNQGAGISMSGGSLVMDTANIQQNFGDGIDAAFGANVSIGGGTVSNNGGGFNINNATLKLRNVTSTLNSQAPPIEASYAMLDIKGGSIAAGPSLGLPAIVAYHSHGQIDSTTVTAPSNSNALAVLGGGEMLLHQTHLASSDINDPTLNITDGSTVISAGGNTITNSGTGATAIQVANASTFHERTDAVVSTNFATAADTITGGGIVQMQSNMELGTGATTPSTWTGAITVAQNSSFRMDGGMSISSSVTLGQGSNGFFNTAGGGSNTVTGTVKCTGSSAHVAGPNSVTPHVTLVATGTGCYAF